MNAFWDRILRQKPRSEFILSTKVGRVFKPARDPDAMVADFFIGGLPFEFTCDYSYDGIMRSHEDSLTRLGLPSIDVLVNHDLEFWFHETEAGRSPPNMSHRMPLYLTIRFQPKCGPN